MTQREVEPTIQVLVVDDDPMVAHINKYYVEMIPGFACVSTASRGEEALELLAVHHIDLVLLDIFMPGAGGLDVLREIRRARTSVDVIVISAASDIDSIQAALRLGAVDYLIKPFEFERFQDALMAYQREHDVLHHQQHLSQNDIDKWLFRKGALAGATELPKGITKATLKRVLAHIDELGGQLFATETLASRVGISRVSMRKYLYFLQDIGVLAAEMEYKSVGRPSFRYRTNPGHINAVKPYLQ